MINRSLLLVLFCLPIMACEQTGTILKYKVHRTGVQPVINAEWDKLPWTEIEPLQMQYYMGDVPEHFPFTQAKMTYDDLAVYLIFRVEDRYVKAVHQNNQDPVYFDSCVEFFFSPGESAQKGYFNLEMNCGGTMLFHHQEKPRTNRTLISEEHIQQIEVAHSLPDIVDPEIENDTTWTVEYRIPFSVLTNYHALTNPDAGTVWRANFYKCADQTSHPHWLTWAPIDSPKPDFHLPEYFGILEFQK